ncbi:hypothetical protein AAC387_Pa11g1345 [Persea americana]
MVKTLLAISSSPALKLAPYGTGYFIPPMCSFLPPAPPPQFGILFLETMTRLVKYAWRLFLSMFYTHCGKP